MRCSKCGFDNPEGMKFCGQCANALTLICPRCRFGNPPGFRFCGQCTASLAAITKPAEENQLVRVSEGAPDSAIGDGGRKTVTALFADIKGSMELMEDLDPEALARARIIADRACSSRTH